MKNRIRSLIKIKKEGKNKAVFVGKIFWPSPHEPKLIWHRLSNKKFQKMSNFQIIEKVVYNKKYFKICLKCFEIKAVGHMHDDRMCQGCAERHLGVVY